jgi:hypothetical protein
MSAACRSRLARQSLRTENELTRKTQTPQNYMYHGKGISGKKRGSVQSACNRFRGRTRSVHTKLVASFLCATTDSLGQLLKAIDLCVSRFRPDCMNATAARIAGFGREIKLSDRYSPFSCPPLTLSLCTTAMSKPYYTPNGHRYNSHASSSISLKPMLQNQAPLPSTGSSFNNDTYNPVASSNPVQDQETNLLATADQRLKQRIRILKLASRIVALVLSLATLIPLATTLTKFFETKNEVFVVDGQERTAWAKDSRVWYTYMYFGVALTSFVFDLVVVVAYCRGVKRANTVAAVATWWSTTVQVGHVLIWIVSAAVYRYGKEPVGGKFRDLWGW